MNNNPVMIEMAIIFDPADGWSQLSQFENELAQFFLARGFNANKLNTKPEGKLVIQLSKLKDLTTPHLPEQKSVPVVDDLRAIRTYTQTTPRKLR